MILLGGCGLFAPKSAEITIKTYYVRYDLKTEAHHPTEENLLMAPAGQEFRMENFSPVTRTGVIPLTPKESKNNLHLRARDTTLKAVLREKGLKSVKSQNLVTLVSYEGIIRSPVDIEQIPCPESGPGYYCYRSRLEFAPVAFPAQWKHLKTRYETQQKMNDFFDLFY